MSARIVAVALTLLTAALPASAVPRPARSPAAPSTPRVTPDAPFRAHAPAAAPTPAFRAPVATSFTLPNGLTVLLVERHDLPVVAVQFVTRGAADSASPQDAGLAGLVTGLLEQGTRHRDAIALADAFSDLGADHSAGAGWDQCSAWVRVLSPQLEPALALLLEEISEPAFDPAEIERQRALRLAAVRREMDSPPSIAGNTVARVLYGDAHPFGRSLLGTAASLQRFTREDIVAFHRTRFVPATSALVLVGDVTRARVEPLLGRTFGAWRPEAPPLAAPSLPAAPDAIAPRIVFVQRPRAPQSLVLVTQDGVPRSVADYVPTAVMNTILGGMFSSRINMNLREAHAYTYGARSSFAMRRLGGPFVVGGAIVAESTAAAVREILTEVRRMRDTAPQAQELATAVARVTDALPAQFEAVGQIASTTSELFAFGLPLDEYVTLPDRARAVTPEAVQAAARAHLDPDRLRIVVVGEASVLPSLRALATELHETRIEMRDAEGNLLPPVTVDPPAAPAR